MDYGKALKAVFEDKDWIGVILIGGALGLVSLLFFWTIIIPFIVAAVLYGYMMQYIRDVRVNANAGLPDWTDWGKKMADGFKLMIVQFIWALPLFILLMPVLFMFGLLALYSDSEALAVITMIVSFGTMLLAMIYGIVFVFLIPAITINLAVQEDFSAGLDVRTIFGMTKSHFVDILIILILLYGISYVAGWVGMLLLLFGVVFTSFWVMLVRGHLFGQLARLALPVVDPADTPLPVPVESKSDLATD
jgi:hypothetical protein